MAVITKETSYTSTSVYYVLNSVSASHSGSTLSVTINITLKNDGSSSLGSGDARIRNCYLYDGSGSLFSGTYCLKNASTSWGSSLNSTWTITYTKNIGYGAWSSNCYIRIGADTNWTTSSSTNSFWWNGRKSTNTGSVGQTFAVSVGSTYVLPTVSAPAAEAVNEGANASFSVTASGGVPASYSYQWQVSTNSGTSYSNMSGETSSSLTVATSKAMNGYYYRCVVSNSAGSKISSGAKLTVYYKMALNTSYPKNTSVNNASTATFTVSISTAGYPAAYTYQWYKNGTSISGATAASYTTPTLYTTDNGNTYYCIVNHTQTSGTTQSRTATVTVLGYKATTTSPSSVKANEGASTTLEATITVGNPTSTTIQWQVSTDGTTFTNYGSSSTITENATKTLTLSSLTYTADNNKKYRVAATNTIGTTYSAAATITVNRKPNTPALIFPSGTTTKITYNKKPYILFKWGIDEDGDAIKGCVTFNGTTYTSDTISFLNGGLKTTAEQSLVKVNETAYSASPITITAYSNDGLINSNTVSTYIYVSDPNFTDTITANQTKIKAVHFTQLRTKINNLETYYNLTNTVWTNTITGGTTKIKGEDILEMRQALQRIATYLNGFGANITLTWTDSTLENKRIKAVHINELRNALTSL